MKAAIAPLAAIPGVTLAMLVSQDGMPIVVRGDHRLGASDDAMQDARLEDADVLAALAAGWISDLTRAAAPISWSPPRYLVLRAARGSLLAMQVPRALLIVLLGPGMRPADFRLSMEAAVARMERGLRADAQRTGAGVAGELTTEPAGIFPDRPTASAPETEPNDVAKKNGASQPYGPTGE
jgi:predicted regulator of Ras-like GTPase activity (Roadblock/LC7/MglB family)